MNTRTTGKAPPNRSKAARMASATFWAENEVEIRKLRSDGLTFEAIAQKLGVTRGAVLGRANRMGLIGNSATLRASRQAAAAAERRRAKIERLRHQLAILEAPEEQHRLAMEGQMTDLRSTLTELCEAFNAHDLDRIMSFFADDCVLEMPRGSEPWGTRFGGNENVRAALATRFEGLPDVHYGDGEHFVDASAETGISKWILTGTMKQGKRIEVRGCDFYTFRGDKVTRKDSYWKIVE